MLGIDDAVECRWGAQISARGIDRDPVRSGYGHCAKASSLRWLCVMPLAPVPWAGSRTQLLIIGGRAAKRTDRLRHARRCRRQPVPSIGQCPLRTRRHNPDQQPRFGRVGPGVRRPRHRHCPTGPAAAPPGRRTHRGLQPPHAPARRPAASGPAAHHLPGRPAQAPGPTAKARRRRHGGRRLSKASGRAACHALRNPAPALARRRRRAARLARPRRRLGRRPPGRPARHRHRKRPAGDRRPRPFRPRRHPAATRLWTRLNRNEMGNFHPPLTDERGRGPSRHRLPPGCLAPGRGQPHRQCGVLRRRHSGQAYAGACLAADHRKR